MKQWILIDSQTGIVWRVNAEDVPVNTDLVDVYQTFALRYEKHEADGDYDGKRIADLPLREAR